MKDFDPPHHIVKDVVERALWEDFGTVGDLTAIATILDERAVEAKFVARAEGTLAGTAAASETFLQVDSSVELLWTMSDGETLHEGTVFGTAKGSMRSILGAERTALNFLCHCSGIATLTRRFVRAARSQARIRDTRKTTPGLRALEKAAVRAGGGFNHRESLSDAILIKDNHLVALGIKAAVERCRMRWPGRSIEVECDTMEQVGEVLEAQADLVLLDNMTPEQVKEAAAALGGKIPIEISGGIDLKSVASYLDCGADFISVGSITHSAPILDLALDIEAQ